MAAAVGSSSISFGVRTPARLIRCAFDAATPLSAVAAQVASDLGVPPSAVTLSLKPTGGDALASITKVGSLGIAGKLLYASLPPGTQLPTAAASSTPPTAASAGAASGTSTASAASAGAGGASAAAATPKERVLTARCQHGPHGACQYCCAPTDDDFKKKKETTLNKAAEFVERHAEKSSAPSTLSGELEWLCHHRPDQMCVNCAPLRKGETVELEMLCQHGPEARCINCLPPDTTVEGRKFQTYDEWLERARDKCQHAFTAVCVNCMPPSDIRYKMKPDCGRHRPWPAGICLECAPATVDLTRQPYRHVDFAQVDCVAEMGSFVDLVSVNERAGVQRAALIYGRIVPDVNFRHGQRVVVDALYEPPQLCDPVSGAVRLVDDPAESTVNAVAKELGIAPVGWLFSRKLTRESKGVELLPHELYAIAGQQLCHPRADGRSGSQWLTLTISRDAKTGDWAPHGFMASDQLVAAVRDGVISPPKYTDVKFKRREAAAGEPPIPEIIQKDQVRGAYRVTEFDPDIMVITVEVAGAKDKSADAARPLFQHNSFPVENRAAFGVVQSHDALKRHLQRYSSEPYQKRLSDFHALLYLAQAFDEHTAVAAAKSVKAGTPLDEGVEIMLSAIEFS